jgi:SAM-dependent methyltransferase
VKLDDPAVVQRDYATETRLLGRRSIYEASEGPSALDVLWDAICEARPRDVLEVGPGPGELSERIAAELDASVTAVDISPRMVELTRARGIDARLGDVQSLEFGDESFDLVVAAWVLFHPSDLDRALSEIVRVLRREGRLIAATNSVQHLRELWALVGVERTRYSFCAESADAALRRHFGDRRPTSCGGMGDIQRHGECARLRRVVDHLLSPRGSGSGATRTASSSKEERHLRRDEGLTNPPVPGVYSVAVERIAWTDERLDDLATGWTRGSRASMPTFANFGPRSEACG